MKRGIIIIQNLNKKKKALHTAIKIYSEQIVIPRLSDIKQKLLLQIIFFFILFVFTVVTNLQSNFFTIIGSFGFVISAIVVDWDKLRTTHSKFQKDRLTLKESIAILLIKYTLADNDLDRLNEVEDFLNSIYEVI